MTTSFNTDDGANVNLSCKRNRSFQLTIDLQRPLSAYTYKMQLVNDKGGSALTFSLSDGISINGNKLQLSKSYSAMSLPTGVYSYDLIEMQGETVNTILFGQFTIEPSITQL